MTNKEYFKLQSKNLLKDSKSEKPRWFPDALFLIDKYNKSTNLTLMQAQHIVAKISGFEKWDDLQRCTEEELGLIKVLFENRSIVNNAPVCFDGNYARYIIGKSDFIINVSEFIKNNFSKIKNVDYKSLNKSDVESYFRRTNGIGELKMDLENPFYISKPAFLTAVLRAGFDIKNLRKDGNANFNMSRKDVNKFCKIS